MQRRNLDGTSISVSEFALGTMMFGAMGNTDHDETARTTAGSCCAQAFACRRRRLTSGVIPGEPTHSSPGSPRTSEATSTRIPASMTD
jgi:hypothetical protein